MTTGDAREAFRSAVRERMEDQEGLGRDDAVSQELHGLMSTCTAPQVIGAIEAWIVMEGPRNPEAFRRLVQFIRDMQGTP